MNRWGAGFALASFSVAACGASVPAPREREAVAAATVRQARQAGAQESQEGVLKVQLAEEQLENARALMRRGEHAAAARVLVRGEADAELALAIARENKARAAADVAIAQAESVRAKTESLRAKAAMGAGATEGAAAPPTAPTDASQAGVADLRDLREAEARSSAERDKLAREAMDKIPLMGIGTVRLEDRGTVITMAASALFLPDGANLVPAARANLDVVAEALGSPAAHRVTIQGYSDSQGAERSNRELCDQQARAVMTYLVSRGVPSGIVRAEGIGAARPIADNGTMAGRAKNRRIEIAVTPETSHP